MGLVNFSNDCVVFFFVAPEQATQGVHAHEGAFIRLTGLNPDCGEPTQHTGLFPVLIADIIFGGNP